MKTPVIIPVSGKTNVKIVVEQLEKLIQDGYWEPETRIWSESELCGKFNVGRSTVREAINMLKAKNLVYIVPGLGTFVSKPSEIDSNFIMKHMPDPKSGEGLLNILELRIGLEPINAALAAKRGTRSQIDAIRKSIDDRRTLDTESADAFARNDMGFHMLVAQAANNPIVMNVMNMAVNYFLTQQILTSHSVSRRRKAQNFHEQILNAIETRQPVLAERVMREHVEEGYAHVQSLVSMSKSVSGRRTARDIDAGAARSIDATAR